MAVISEKDAINAIQWPRVSKGCHTQSEGVQECPSCALGVRKSCASCSLGVHSLYTFLETTSISQEWTSLDTPSGQSWPLLGHLSEQASAQLGHCNFSSCAWESGDDANLLSAGQREHKLWLQYTGWLCCEEIAARDASSSVKNSRAVPPATVARVRDARQP